MNDHDIAEMRALCEQFRRVMAREIELALFEEDARVRMGEMIGRAARQGRSDYVSLR